MNSSKSTKIIISGSWISESKIIIIRFICFLLNNSFNFFIISDCNSSLLSNIFLNLNIYIGISYNFLIIPLNQYFYIFCFIFFFKIFNIKYAFCNFELFSIINPAIWISPLFSFRLTSFFTFNNNCNKYFLIS